MVLNPGAGGDEENLRQAVEERFSGVRFLKLDADGDLGASVREAVDEGRPVVAAGGDGTVSAVAQHLVETRGVLGVLPAGTRNHFARDLGVGDLRAALDAVAEGRPRRIDVGRVSGSCFVNNVGLGLYPEVVRERERSEDRVGRWPAAAAAALRVVRRARRLAGTIEVDGDARRLQAWMVFVGNNRFQTARGHVGARERLDEGILDVGLLLADPRGAGRSQIAWRTLRHRPWQTSRRLVRHTGGRVEVRLHGPARLLSRDGEVEGPTDHLVAEILPRALRVLAPGEGSVR